MSSTRFDIAASAAQTATGQTGALSVGNIKEMAIMVDVTVVSGSLSAVYMQGSSDGGTTWYDLIAENFVNLTSGAASGTTGTWARNMVSSLTTGAVIKAFGGYKTFGDYIRGAWVIAGSGPTATFSIKGIGKN